MKIDHIRIAAEQGLGRIASDEIRVVGESIDSVKTSLKLPPGTLTELVASFTPKLKEKVSVIEGEACSGCTSQILLALNKLGRTEPEFIDSMGPITMVIGPGAKLPAHVKNALLVGNCTKGLRGHGRSYVEGCMPWSIDIINGIKRLFERGR